jgi:hypothetical protein
MKRCTKCGEMKPRSQFSKDARNNDGLQSHCKACKNKHWRAWVREKQETDPDYGKNYLLMKTYGITLAEKQKMLEEQGGKCANPGCNATEPGGKGEWHLDHDHRFPAKDKRGHRGLLCCNCNVGLGNFSDDTEKLKGAILYLERHQLELLIKKEAV